MKYNQFIALGLASILLSSTPVLAATTSTSSTSSAKVATDSKPVLTLESAINSAISIDKSLSLNAQEAKLLKEKLNSESLPISTYQQQYISKQQNSKDREYLIDSISYKVKSAYNTLLLQEEQMANSKTAIELKTTQLANMAVKRNLGLITDLEYESAELELANLKANLDSTSDSFKSNAANFRILTGRSLDSYSLENNIHYDIFTVPTSNIEAYFKGKVQTYLQYKTELIKVQEDNMFDSYITYAPTYVEYLSQKFNIRSSEISLEKTKDSLTQSLITSYSNLLSLQEQITTLEEKYTYSQKQLDVMELQYNLGLLSKLDYLTHKNSLKDMEYNLLNLKNQYSLLAEMLQKPWLMG